MRKKVYRATSAGREFRVAAGAASTVFGPTPLADAAHCVLATVAALPIGAVPSVARAAHIAALSLALRTPSPSVSRLDSARVDFVLVNDCYA
jgi:hypothetical protein